MNGLIRNTVALLALACMSAPWAQQSGGSSEYVLGPEDVIEVSVTPHEGYNKTLTVMQDGTITFPGIGEIKAAGMTPKQLAADIKEKLGKTLNNVTVTVNVVEAKSRRVRIFGPVRTQSAYSLKPGWRVLDLIVEAGGLTARPERVKGQIIRGNDIIPIDLAKADKEPTGAANPVLKPDDLVMLKEADPASNKVYVTGTVERSGALDIGEEGLTIPAALAQAGKRMEFAELTRVTVFRGQEEFSFDVVPFYSKGIVSEQLRSFKLQAGDIVFVPETERVVGVMGQVNRPGKYPMPEGRPLTVVEALSLAGGQTERAELRGAGIVRTENGVPKAIPVNVNDMFRKGSKANQLVLLPSDILFIPTKGERTEWRDILAPLSLLRFFFGVP